MDGKTNEIHGLMVKVLRSLGYIGKDRQVTYGERFHYRGIDDVINALGDAIREHGVVMSVETSDEKIEPHVLKGKHGDRPVFMCSLRMAIRFIAPDGSEIALVGFGMGIDDSDKAVGKAMSNVYKETLFKGLAIPTAPGVQQDVEQEELTQQEPGRREEKPVSTRKQAGWPGPKDMEAMSIDDLRALAQKIASTDGKDSTAYKQCVEIGGKKKASAA